MKQETVRLLSAAAELKRFSGAKIHPLSSLSLFLSIHKRAQKKVHEWKRTRRTSVSSGCSDQRSFRFDSASHDGSRVAEKRADFTRKTRSSMRQRPRKFRGASRRWLHRHFGDHRHTAGTVNTHRVGSGGAIRVRRRIRIHRSARETEERRSTDPLPACASPGRRRTIRGRAAPLRSGTR